MTAPRFVEFRSGARRFLINPASVAMVSDAAEMCWITLHGDNGSEAFKVEGTIDEVRARLRDEAVDASLSARRIAVALKLIETFRDDGDEEGTLNDVEKILQGVP